VDKLALARGAVKGMALLVGFPATLLCLTATVGLVAENGWLRLGVAAVVAIVVPAVLADRLLPDSPDTSARGLTSDVFALGWLGFPLVFAVALGSFTQSVLTREGQRLNAAGFERLAGVAYLFAAVEPSVALATPEPPDPASVATATAPTATEPEPSAPTARPTAEPVPPDKPAPKTDGELDASELFKQWAPAVVSIAIRTPTASGGGTGFLIDDEGTIATNHHVIEHGGEAVIKFMNGALYKEIWVLADDPDADLAILRVNLKKPDEGDPPDVTPTELGDSESVVVGERAISIGNPLGLEHTLTTGIVSARRTYAGKNWIQMSTPVSPGNSGGPVFNGRGQVIGVTTAIIGGYGVAQNLNLAVPIDSLKSRLKKDYPGKRKYGAPGGSQHW
jgi:serine protease Do